MTRQEIENQLGLKLPIRFESYNKDLQILIVAYLQQLSDIDKKAYKIGQEHLGTSFNLIKSNGFSNWVDGKQS